LVVLDVHMKQLEKRLDSVEKILDIYQPHLQQMDAKLQRHSEEQKALLASISTVELKVQGAMNNYLKVYHIRLTVRYSIMMCSISNRTL
jgi:chromosome segregation ATPase